MGNRAYKFIASKYAKAFERGEIRISPAWTFREDDGIVAGRSDPLELAQVTMIGGELRVGAGSIFNPPAFYSVGANGEKIGLDLIMTGDTAIVYHGAALFCMSRDFDDAILARMATDFGNDAAFEIADVTEFAKLIAKIDDLSRYEVIAGDVHYADALEVDAHSDVPDFFIKHSKYSWQREFRLVWPSCQIAEPTNFNCPEISNLIRRVA